MLTRARKIYSIGQAATALGIRYDSVREAIRRGTLKASWNGTRHEITSYAVKAYKSRQMKRSKVPPKTPQENVHIHQKIIQNYDDRRQAIAYLGGKCACCGSVDYLEIDHKNGDGKAHRSEIAPQRIEEWLRENGYPDGFQLLCNRCNMSKFNGPSCRIDHSKDIINKTEELPMRNNGDLSKEVLDLDVSSEQADQLVNLNTRIPVSVKAILQGEATARAVALGVIIAERVTNSSVIAMLTCLEAKIDALAAQVDSMHLSAAKDEPLPEKRARPSFGGVKPKHIPDLSSYEWPQPEPVPLTWWQWFRGVKP